MDRFELLNEIRTGRKKLKRALEQVDRTAWEKPGMDGGWSVKDMLAHLAFWESRTLTLYRAVKNNREPSPSLKDRDIDDVNAEVYTERKAWPLEKVIQDEEQAYQELLELVESVPEEDLFGPYRFALLENRPFYEWVDGNTYGHYAEHIDMLEKSTLAPGK
jgi:hypothetical protein